MDLSARNQLSGTIVSLTRGPVTTLVKMDVGGQYLSATVTTEAADQMGLIEGRPAVAIFKASSVILGVE